MGILFTSAGAIVPVLGGFDTTGMVTALVLLGSLGVFGYSLYKMFAGRDKESWRQMFGSELLLAVGISLIALAVVPLDFTMVPFVGASVGVLLNALVEILALVAVVPLFVSGIVAQGVNFLQRLKG